VVVHRECVQVSVLTPVLQRVTLLAVQDVVLFVLEIAERPVQEHALKLARLGALRGAKRVVREDAVRPALRLVGERVRGAVLRTVGKRVLMFVRAVVMLGVAQRAAVAAAIAVFMDAVTVAQALAMQDVAICVFLAAIKYVQTGASGIVLETVVRLALIL